MTLTTTVRVHTCSRCNKNKPCLTCFHLGERIEICRECIEDMQQCYKDGVVKAVKVAP